MSINVFDNIYEEYKDLIYNYICKLVSDKDTAEDLVQECFIKVYKSLNKFRGDCSIKLWLFKIAKNVCYTWYKKNNIEFLEFDETYITSINYIPSNDTDTKLLIEDVFKYLSPDQKEFIILRDYSGFNYNEIAHIKNITEGQVKIGLHRARKKFKEIYMEMIK